MWSTVLRRSSVSTPIITTTATKPSSVLYKGQNIAATATLRTFRYISSTPTPTSGDTNNAYPLQQESAQDAPLAIGNNLILQRVANMIVNITEKHVAKILQIHPESSCALQSYLGKISHVELNGYSTAKESHRDFKYKNKYNHIEYEDHHTLLGTVTKLPFKSAGYDVVIQCLPLLHPEPLPSSTIASPVTLISPPSLPLSELLRVLNDRGFFIVGFPETLWTQYEIQAEVDRLCNQNGNHQAGEWLVFQKIPIPLRDIACFEDGTDDALVNDWCAFDSQVVLKKTQVGPPSRNGDSNKASSSNGSSSGSSSSNNKGEEIATISYCLALFRKK